MLPSLATPEDATGYGYALPADTAEAWLARASVRVRRAAGWAITAATSTVRLPADHHEIVLPSPPVTDVASVAAVDPDGTTTPLTVGVDWAWDGQERIRLATWLELAEVVYTHGFTTIPDDLIELVCSVAQRLSNTPVGMEAGIRSVTIDDYSRTFAAEARTDAASLLPGEQDALNSILAVPRVWLVKSR